MVGDDVTEPVFVELILCFSIDGLILSPIVLTCVLYKLLF